MLSYEKLNPKAIEMAHIFINQADKNDISFPIFNLTLNEIQG